MLCSRPHIFSLNFSTWQRFATSRSTLLVRRFNDSHSTPRSNQVNPVCDHSTVEELEYARRNLNCLGAQADSVRLSDELMRCKAELELERKRRREADEDAELEMQLRYLQEEGGEDTRHAGARAREWERRFHEATRERDLYWSRLNESEGFRQRLRESQRLLSDLTAGRGDAALRLHRAGELCRRIPAAKRDMISHWIDGAETAMLSQRALRQILQRRR